MLHTRAAVAADADPFARQMRATCGDGYREARALARTALDRDVSPVQAREVTHQREPDAAALVAARASAFDAMKALEHARKLCRRDTDAAVVHAKHHLPVGMAKG